MFERLFGFRGVASRLHFWTVTASVVLLSLLYLRFVFFGLGWVWGNWQFLHLLFFVLMALLMLSVTVRRLKDLSQSPLWGLLVLAPPLLLVLLVPLGFFRGTGDYREIRRGILT